MTKPNQTTLDAIKSWAYPILFGLVVFFLSDIHSNIKEMQGSLYTALVRVSVVEVEMKAIQTQVSELKAWKNQVDKQLYKGVAHK